VEAALHVGFPCAREVAPAYLVNPAHVRRRAGVEHQHVRTEVREDLNRRGLVRDVSGHGDDTQPLFREKEGFFCSGNDYDFCSFVDERFN
jgi:hypothetical protein